MKQSNPFLIPGLPRLALLALALCFSSATLADEIIYTWHDDDGIRHFSARPPEGREYWVVEGLVSSSATVRGTPRTRPDTAPSAASAEARSAERSLEVLRERCEQAQQNLALLREDRPAMLRQEDGEAVPMDDDARREMIEEMEAFVADWC